jgi:hypothetical protein
MTLFHKPGKKHIVPDALSCLPSFARDELNPTTLDTDPLDILFGHALHGNSPEQPQPTVIGIALTNDFKQKVIAGYSTDKRWSRVLHALQNNSNSSVPVTLPYHIHENLLYTNDAQGVAQELTYDPFIFVPKDYRVKVDFTQIQLDSPPPTCPKWPDLAPAMPAAGADLGNTTHLQWHPRCILSHCLQLAFLVTESQDALLRTM